MVQYAVLSKNGGRQINEDSIAAQVIGNANFFVLADGLGGHGSGEVASALAVQAAMRVLSTGNLSFSKRLAACIMEGQQDILAEQQRTGRRDDSKTTLVVLQIEAGQAQWAHVGDSRLYWFTGSKLVGHTLDHSVPQMLVDQGEIRERDIRNHEDRNRLTRVLGMEWDAPKYSLSKDYPTEQAAVFLLCSDGFWELIDEKQMARLLKRSATPELWLTEMEKIVLKNGAGKKMDNYSAIAVWT